MTACGFVNMENPGNVRPEDFFKGALNGYTAKMQDGVDAFYQMVNRLFVRKIAEDDF